MAAMNIFLPGSTTAVQQTSANVQQETTQAGNVDRRLITISIE
jgi:hypothetical protein